MAYHYCWENTTTSHIHNRCPTGLHPSLGIFLHLFINHVHHALKGIHTTLIFSLKTLSSCGIYWRKWLQRRLMKVLLWKHDATHAHMPTDFRKHSSSQMKKSRHLVSKMLLILTCLYHTLLQTMPYIIYHQYFPVTPKIYILKEHI